MQTCPTCDAPRDGAVRLCRTCGHDYWQAAAHAAAPLLPAPKPAEPPATRLPMLLVTAGVVILVTLGVAAAVISGIGPIAGLAGPPTATPRQLTPGEALVHAFFREVRDPSAEYRVSADATITFSGLDEEISPVSATSEIRIHRADWAGTETVTDDETTVNFELALVDGVAHVREDGGEWISREIPDRLHPISPFRRISTVTEVEHVGSAIVDGAPQHTLVITKWLGGRDFSDLLRRFARIVSQESRMEVTVDSFGVPSVAELEIAVVATDGVDTLTIEGRATYRFADWDELDPIDWPPATDTPSA